MKDIETVEDIRLLVDEFYAEVRLDPVIGYIFNTALNNRWSIHLEKMYRFWQTVLLAEHTYSGSPFLPHAKMPLEQKHFNTWLKIWHTTVDKNFIGTKAEEAKWRGDKMANMFFSKIEYYRINNLKPLI